MKLAFEVTTEFHTKEIPFYAKEASLWAIGLKEVPLELANCQILERLDLSTNSLRNLRALLSLSKLSYISLDYNELEKLERLPDGVEVVCARKNRLKEVRLQLPALRELYLSGNQLKRVPKGIDGVRVLHLGDNPIEDMSGLPDSLEELEISIKHLRREQPLPRNLKRLILCGGINKSINLLKMIPPYLESVSYAWGCPIRLPTADLINSGQWAKAQRDIDNAVAVRRNFISATIPICEELYDPVPAVVLSKKP